MDKQNKEFGELLKLLRKQQGLNQKELADKLYVSASAVSKWENGKNLPDLIMLKKLTEILQISYDNLLCPEEALKKLKASGKQSSEADGLTEKALQIDANETIVSKEKGNGHKKNMLLAVCALLLIVIATGGVVYRNTSNGAKIRLVAERYEYIETWGKEVYQQAYVVDGEIDNEVVEQHMEKIKKKYLSDAGMAEKDFVMLFYYSDENAALNWEYTEYGGGFTLNSITEGERQ